MNDDDLGLRLERLVAERKRIGPSPELERAVWAIPSTTPPVRRWLPHIHAGGFTVFSALKLLAAGVIVALFGGFLLAGVLTAPPEGEVLPGAASKSPPPMTTEELLSGMVTEEVEPGVLRVASDGVRDLTALTSEAPVTEIMAGPDGSVWIHDAGRWLQLGRPEPEAVLGSGSGESEVAPDGTLWAVAGGSVYSFKSGSWTEWGVDAGTPVGLAIGSDGTAWVMAGAEIWNEATGLYRATDDGLMPVTPDWTSLDLKAAGLGQIVAAPDGAVWLIGVDVPDGAVYDYLPHRMDAFMRFDGSAWERLAVPDDLGYVTGQSFDIGSDGTLWAAIHRPGDDGDVRDGLARLDSSGWTVFDAADGVRPWGLDGFVPTDHLHVAPDGSVWVNAKGNRSSCGGVGHFDGTTWTGYLSDLCVHDMDITPDGAVWVRAGTFVIDAGFEEWDPPATYVITSGAVAATK
jgi:hypothetical protein